MNSKTIQKELISKLRTEKRLFENVITLKKISNV